MPAPVVVWFRRDLRLEDNPALHAAASAARPVVPLFIWAPDEDGAWPAGSASRWWLDRSLRLLDDDLRALGASLLIRRGPTLAALLEVIRQTGASTIYWNRRYEPAAIACDREVKAALRSMGVEVRTFNASLLVEPWVVATKAGTPFQVFTPFWRTICEMLSVAPALPAPLRIAGLAPSPASLPLDGLDLQPRIDWAAGLRDAWVPGEAGAADALREFCAEHLRAYARQRDVPGVSGTSRLSPYLHFGEIGPRQVWRAVSAAVGRDDGCAPAADTYLREIGWREFGYHLLFHFPDTPTLPLRPAFRAFPWADDPRVLRAWQRGRTGYPIVDAGMRELWATGWMHNRVRMIVASFLVKHLLLPWQAGAAWFWDTLVDADLASNTLGWQWTAGCGADAAPYFRVFNPILQGEKFDPLGTYVRRWVPELAALPNALIHQPWKAGPLALAAAGVVLGRDYPQPIVEHAAARQRALAAFARIKHAAARAEGDTLTRSERKLL